MSYKFESLNQIYKVYLSLFNFFLIFFIFYFRFILQYFFGFCINFLWDFKVIFKTIWVASDFIFQSLLNLYFLKELN